MAAFLSASHGSSTPSLARASKEQDHPLSRIWLALFLVLGFQGWAGAVGLWELLDALWRICFLTGQVVGRIQVLVLLGLIPLSPRWLWCLMQTNASLYGSGCRCLFNKGPSGGCLDFLCIYHSEMRNICAQIPDYFIWVNSWKCNYSVKVPVRLWCFWSLLPNHLLAIN